MKFLILVTLAALGTIAYAGQAEDKFKAKEVIKTSAEPGTFVMAYLARGFKKCNPIEDQNIRIEKFNSSNFALATVNVNCTDIDAEGGAVPTRNILQFRGRVYIGESKFFVLDSMAILPDGE